MEIANNFLNLGACSNRTLKLIKVYLTKEEIEALRQRSQLLTQILGKKITISKLIRMKVFYDNKFEEIYLKYDK